MLEHQRGKYKYVYRSHAILDAVNTAVKKYNNLFPKEVNHYCKKILKILIKSDQFCNIKTIETFILSK